MKPVPVARPLSGGADGDVQQLTEQQVARFERLLASQQEELNGLKESLSPVAVQAVAVPASSTTLVPLTLDEIEAKQKEIQVARFEALLAEQRRKMSAMDGQ